MHPNSGFESEQYFWETNIVKYRKKKGPTPKAGTNNKNPAKKTKQDSDQSRDDIIPTKNAFAGLAIDEPEIVVTDKTAQVADLPPKLNLQCSGFQYRGAITTLLKQKEEEFYVIPSAADRPLKVVSRGSLLPLRLRILKRTSPNKVLYSSDHNPLILNFQTTIQFNFPTRNVSTDWERFRTHLSNKPPTFQPITAHTGEEIEKQVSNFTNQILAAYNSASKPIHTNNNFYIDSDLKRLFKLRNKARKIYQYTRHPSDNTILNRLQHKIHRKVRDFTQKQWEETLIFLDTDDGSLCGLARCFMKRSPIPTHTTIAYSDTEKAETFMDSLENQFKLNDISSPQHDKNHTWLVSRVFTNDNNFDDNPTIPKSSEILTYINKLKLGRLLEGKEFRTRWFETLIKPLSLSNY
ncbi:RNA-directed DNA polymerase from mobile element jockey [Trichonephila inaurata madagascariensis]|uniref:RNA-directed DNA polymerase from mobile element jockey n=1 Tax=Trichonephila inaurata madagascariensis TaxID=2747483 RepID=A0A8X6IYE5_9ARAC|nr:RNA-directed DNA polymerase from mobile element jockey [Trichonephila inaurata madagascariensis]